MASPDSSAARAHVARPTNGSLEWHERILARPFKEGAIVLAVALLSLVMRTPRPLFTFFVWPTLLGGTVNVMARFRSPASRDWWLSTGQLSRRALARFVLVEVLACSAPHAVALTLVRLRFREGFEALGLSAQLGSVQALGLLFLLHLAARAALACVRHVGTCTSVPSALRATANGFRRGPAATWALLLQAALAALLAAPLVLGAVRGQPLGFWIAPALLYPLLLAGMIASSEAVTPRFTPDLFGSNPRLADFVRMPRLLPARSARFAPRTGFLWSGLKPSVRLLALLFVLLLALGLSLYASEWPLPAAVITALCLFTIAAVDTPFSWRSEGAQAAYLYAAGIDHGRQRRAELLCGALVLATTFAFAVWLFWTTQDELALIVLLPAGSSALLRSVRGRVLGDRTGRALAPVLFTAAMLQLFAVLVAARLLGLERGELSRGAKDPRALVVVVETVLVLGTAVSTLAPIFLWLRAWRGSRDEGELKVAIHG